MTVHGRKIIRSRRKSPDVKEVLIHLYKDEEEAEDLFVGGRMNTRHSALG